VSSQVIEHHSRALVVAKQRGYDLSGIRSRPLLQSD
jgi:hypothetical protein